MTRWLPDTVLYGCPRRLVQDTLEIFSKTILEKHTGPKHEGMSLLAAAAHLSEEELRMLVAARRYAALRAGSSDASVVPICGDELSGGSCDL